MPGMLVPLGRFLPLGTRPSACAGGAPAGSEKAHGGLRGRRWVSRMHRQRASATDVCPHFTEGRQDRDLQDLPLPPGDGSLPLVGATLDFLANQDEFVNKRVRKFGPIVGTSFMGKKAVIVAGRDLLEKVMVKNQGAVSQGFYKDFVQLMGPSSLLHLDGPRHMALKRLIVPSLSKRKHKDYIPGIAKMIDKACNRWADMESIVFVDEAHLLFSSLIAEAVLGLELPLGPWSRKEMYASLKAFGNGLFSYGINLPFTKFGKAMAARESLIWIIRMAIERFRRNPNLKGALEALINACDDDGNRLNDRELEDTILTMIYAAIDSSSLVASVAMQNLARTPEVWKRLQKEQDDIITQYGPEMSEEAIDAMHYTTAVYRESVRLLAVPAAFRVANKDFELGGYRIPKGWVVVVTTGATARHFDDEWQVNEDFRPERLLPPSDFYSAHDISFGIGSHLCPGMSIAILEGKIMLATLARGYDLTLPRLEAQLTFDPFPFPEGRQALLVTRRKLFGVQLGDARITEPHISTNGSDAQKLSLHRLPEKLAV